jgi:hypothetical protein
MGSTNRFYAYDDEFQDVFKRGRFNNKEVALFRHLNNRKIQLGTEGEVETYISKVIELFNLPIKNIPFYYHLWINNYREDGRYEDVTNINMEGIYGRGESDTHVTKSEYCKCILHKIPFIYERWWGRWETTPTGDRQYIVQHPWFTDGLYLFKNDTWYVVHDTKGLRCLPADCVRVNFFEIEKLAYGGMTYDEVLNERADAIIMQSGKFLNRPIQRKIRGIKLIFRIESIVRNGHLLDFTIDLLPESDIPTVTEILFKETLVKLYESIHLKIFDSIGKINIRQVHNEQ